MAGLCETPSGSRVRIAVFGRRNAGKSSLVNALAGQEVAIVSDTPGTTADPVAKAMEILPLGPCLLVDTAGLDDEGPLGEKRMARSLDVLRETDIALLATPCGEEPDAEEAAVAAACAAAKTVLVRVRTKRDLAPGFSPAPGETAVSSATGEGIGELRARLAACAPQELPPPLLADLVDPGDMVMCICPIDAAAPKGRLILPQQQAIRELLDRGCSAAVCQPAQAAALARRLGPAGVRFAITDSQAFAEADAALPPEIPLTSFSILFARQKGDLAVFCKGVEAIAALRDGDTVLVSEGCTHRRQCGDIGTVKLPAMLRRHTGKDLKFRFSSGGDFPLGAEPRPALVLHCGGCMLSRRAVMDRMARCAAAGIPVANYGTAMAAMNGISADPATCMAKRRKGGRGG